MKSFNKSSFEPEIINLLLNPNELLISSQNQEIKFLRDEINNKNLIIKNLLKNLKDQNFSRRSDFSNFNNPFEKSNSQDEPFINLKRSFKKYQIKNSKNNYSSPNKYESLVIDDNDDDNDDIIRDTRNKTNKEYNQRDNSGSDNKHNKSISKVKKSDNIRRFNC